MMYHHKSLKQLINRAYQPVVLKTLLQLEIVLKITTIVLDVAAYLKKFEQNQTHSLVTLPEVTLW